MAQIMLTVALPITLAWVMFCVGLSLTPADFKRAAQFPLKIVAGLSAQLIGLPILAYLLVSVLALPQSVAIGLWLLALAPGGASSNAITHLSGGDTALSISMTAISSLIIPFSLPLLLPLLIPDVVLVMPVKMAIMQLIAVTLLPLLLAMTMSHYFQFAAFKVFATWAKQSSLWALFIIVAITVGANLKVMDQLFSSASISVLLLCLAGMCLGVLVAKLIGGGKVLQKTFAIEVGMQNAGTAIFVAVVLLQSPELALTPLLYGILMNIPAFVLIFMSQRAEKLKGGA